MKKVVIAGGTGFIGTYLAHRFQENEFVVKIVSRGSDYIPWEKEELVKALENAELVINLSGKSINCRHTQENQKAIINSRVLTTSMIGTAIKACMNPPKVWINASATGIYDSKAHRPMSEDEGTFGNDFLAQVVNIWEKTFLNFQLPDTRQIALRTSVVLGKKGGALAPLVWLTRFGLGGKQGDGNQMFSWIHLEDYFRILLYVLENESVNGVINATSPEPLPNKQFMQTLRKALHIQVGLNAPEFAINIGAKLIGTEPGLILNSSYVIPKRLTDFGFTFMFPTLGSALNDLLS